MEKKRSLPLFIFLFFNFVFFFSQNKRKMTSSSTTTTTTATLIIPEKKQDIVTSATKMTDGARATMYILVKALMNELKPHFASYNFNQETGVLKIRSTSEGSGYHIHKVSSQVLRNCFWEHLKDKGISVELINYELEAEDQAWFEKVKMPVSAYASW